MSKTIQPISAFAITVLVMLQLTACKTSSNVSYFQTINRDTTLQNTVTRNFDLKIKPDDILAISIASTAPELSSLFNASQSSGTTLAGSASGYLVDKNGQIQVYKLGDVQVAGLTRDELKDKLQRELAPYLKDPVVAVRFANHRVTVLGDVSRPGVVPLANEQMTILEVLGLSGDIAPSGKRNNVLIIRKTGSEKEFHHLNLLDNSIFTSPYFYLQNEDVVYVEPNPKLKAEQQTRVVSYVLSGIGLLTLILNRFVK